MVQKLNGKTLNIILLLLYKFSFDLLYVMIISPLYGYYGFTANFALEKYFLLVIFFLLIITPTVNLYYSNKTSSTAIILFTFMYFIPGLTYISFINVPIKFIFFYLLYWLLILYWNRFMVNIYIPKLKKENAQIFLAVYVAIAFFSILYISAKYTGLRLHFNLDDVYELRAQARLMSFSKITKYIMPIFAITIPVLILYFLINKKKYITTILILLQLLLFSIGGHKFFIFSLLVTFLIFFYYKKGGRNLISLVFFLLNISVFIEYYFRNGTSSIVRYTHFRVLLIPNQISYYIFDFMQKNELLYLRESILRHLGFESPYPKSIFFIIGEEYYHNSFTRANNGMCGDAYSQFGFISLFFYTLLLPFAFNLIQIFAKNLDERIVFLTVFLYAFAFINGSFFTVLLTNGLIITYIILYLMSSIKSKR